MVHALHEAHRVLVPDGIMVDIRPLCDDVPLEVDYHNGHETAGMVDLSPDIARDIKADHAISTILVDGIYKETMVEYFYFAYYWKLIIDMQEDLDENWEGEVNISQEVWERASSLLIRRGPESRLKMAVRMKLGVYRKS